MRDGFTRSVQARLKLLRKTNPETMTPEVDEHLSEAVTHLKSIFPKSSFPKGSHLDLVFSPADPESRLKAGPNQGVPMSLSLEFEGKLVGRVEPPPPHVTAGKAHVYSVASELFLAYFADKDPISSPVSIWLRLLPDVRTDFAPFPSGQRVGRRRFGKDAGGDLNVAALE